MPNRTDVAQGDYEGAAGALLRSIWKYEADDFTPLAFALRDAVADPMLSGGEKALAWFAKQIYNGDLQAHLADLDQDNRRLLIEVLAGFAGVES